MNIMKSLILLFFAVAFIGIFKAIAQSSSSPDIGILSATTTADGVIFESNTTKLQLQFINGKTVRVCFMADKSSTPVQSLVVLQQKNHEVNFNLSTKDSYFEVKTDHLLVMVNRQNGTVSYYDNKGVLLLSEKTNGKVLTPAKVQEEQTFNIKQTYLLNSDEAVYGLGQFQDGIMNWRNHKVTLIQRNMEVAIPFLVSTNHYGIYWDNYSHTEFESADNEMSFWSEVGDQLDYYFIYGATTDEIISGMRFLTGKVPMLPLWAYGYWQSKERYKSQGEVLNIAAEYRKRQLPIDVIVQDWQYWGKYGWSAMLWDESTYPQPKTMLDSLHNIYHMKMMISVWPHLQMGSPVAEELNNKGYLFNNKSWNNGLLYDAYSQEARQIYWKHMSKGLFSVGVDGWWMDATEPEVNWEPTQKSSKQGIAALGKNAQGTFSRYLNTYPLLTCIGAYENQRKETDKKRVMILTRSAFAGQQRTGAITWSGDIGSSYKILKNQISGGLNFSLAANPYWNTDIGGFFPGGSGGEYPKGVQSPSYRELYVRWFQFGTFSPIMRSHGTGTPREIWQFGEKGGVNLRYRLLPYIYSMARKVHSEDYTLMRALPMDFPMDKNTFNINDEYMFGSALLVKPVTEEIYYKMDKPANPIPPACIESPDGHKGAFKAEYFKGTNFDTLSETQYDKSIDFNWGGSAAPGVGSSYFSVRWTGTLTPDETGSFLFYTMSDDAVRLFIDDKLIINNWESHYPVINKVTCTLKKGKKYKIKLEYFNEHNSSVISLTWKTPSQQLAKPAKINTAVPVYLPVCEAWYDFWTGKKAASGSTVERDVPLDIMPLFVKAGSILPLGKFIQYSGEKKNDTLEIRIYKGADGKFDLYEDEGDNYNYEKGAWSIIPFEWKNETNMLTIGDREGEYEGMLKDRIFNIVIVNDTKGTGIDIEKNPDSSVRYNGRKLEIKLI